MIRGLVILAVLAGCAPVRDPNLGVYASPGGQVTSSVSSGVGPVSVGVNNHGGGFIGTRLGPVSLGAGF